MSETHNYNKIDEVIAKKESRDKAIADFENNLKIACASVFATANGQYLAKYLKDICGFTEYQSDVNPNIAIYYKGRRDIYLHLRKFIPASCLINIEIKE